MSRHRCQRPATFRWVRSILRFPVEAAEPDSTPSHGELRIGSRSSAGPVGPHRYLPCVFPRLPSASRGPTGVVRTFHTWPCCDYSVLRVLRARRVSVPCCRIEPQGKEERCFGHVKDGNDDRRGAGVAKSRVSTTLLKFYVHNFFLYDMSRHVCLL